ncbi:methyltransferase domain-containing protein [Streptomyces sp. NA04227]|uniref:class I SAM-dependent methyltransferase n=1 Tax=Streptomyces sp. NA04227 TaxID=2742136 RepID=UPI00159139ED|nr:class I SAM-dependent methyltransferase [Streptomyces sp. NA04227]QKW10161.1 methyltransferase domain-containing protein [Streptomyces sp. NA04227]
MPQDQAVYTHGHHASVLRSHTWRTAANSAAYLIGSLRPDMSVLDVGCGPGTITADLAELVPQGTVTGLDREPGILDRARETVRARGLGNVDFAQGDVLQLPYPDGAFDVVHAHQVLQHVSDPVAALTEMRRVCRPGGLVAARDADYAAMTWFPESAGLDRWLDLYRRVARANGGEPDAGRKLKSWARQAGFTRITATASTWCFASEEEREWWGGLWAERTVASTYADRAVAGGHAEPRDLRDAAAAWHEWSAAEDAWFAVLHGEVLCVA